MHRWMHHDCIHRFFFFFLPPLLSMQIWFYQAGKERTFFHNTTFLQSTNLNLFRIRHWPPEFALNYFSWVGFSFHLRQDEVVGMYVGFVGTCLLFGPGNQRYLQRKAQRPTLGANVHLPKHISWATTNQRTREDPSWHQPSSVGTVQSQQPLRPLTFQAACRGKVQRWKHLSVAN